MRSREELLALLRDYVRASDPSRCVCGWGSAVPIRPECVPCNRGRELRAQIEEAVGYKREVRKEARDEKSV